MIVTGIIFLFLVLYYLLSRNHSLVSYLYAINNTYLSIIEKLSNRILSFWGYSVGFSSHKLIVNGIPTDNFIPVTLYKKWIFVLLLIFWVTKTPIRRKITYSAFLLIISFLLVLAHNILGALLASTVNIENNILMVCSLTFGTSVMLVFFFKWFSDNKNYFIRLLRNLRINTYLIEKKYKTIVFLSFLYVILGFFFLETFHYHAWITFLFRSARNILSLLGYNAVVQPLLLIGDNGSIYMEKYCLGFKTMLLFASIVYLTGDNNKSRWAYIILGILFLNIVNILRFVLLFIHIQNNNGYALSIDLHDLYKYITYTIVFVLWVIWFEKYSDIDTTKNANKNN